jgi:plastocyanin
MRFPIVLLALVAAAIAVAAPAGAKAPVQIQIHHATHGCHTWSVGNNAGRASQTVRVHAGTTFTITNNDVMPHTLVQLAGPKIALNASTMGHMSTMRMSHMGATTQFALRAPGTYRFTTKAGEDYPGVTVKTTGEDNVLRLTVVVA